MPTELSKLQSNVSQFLRSLRSSIERHYGKRQLGGEIERERYAKSVLLVEEAAIRFGSHFKNWHEPTSSDRQAARTELTAFVDRIANTDLTGLAFDARIFKGQTHPVERQIVAPIHSYLSLADGDITVGDALIGFRRYVEDFAVGEDAPPVQLSFEDLLRIVPKQQEGPIQFAVKNDVITVVRRLPDIDEADRATVKATAEYLKGQGERLIEELRNSNCDRRLLERVRELHSQIVANGNIIIVALANNDSSTMAAGLHAELSDAINAMLVAYHSNISQYVAQFPEWQHFASKADALPLDNADAVATKEALGKVIGEVNSHPELAEPEVPKLLQYIHEFQSSPGAHYAGSLISKTAEQTVGALSKVLTGILVVAVLSLTGIGSAVVRVGSPWIKQAIEVLEKKIGKSTE